MNRGILHRAILQGT